MQAGDASRKNVLFTANDQAAQNQYGDSLNFRRIMTTREVGARLKVSCRTVRELAERWHDSGGMEGLRGKKVGSKLWRFLETDVERFMNS